MRLIGYLICMHENHMLLPLPFYSFRRHHPLRRRYRCRFYHFCASLELFSAQTHQPFEATDACHPDLHLHLWCKRDGYVCTLDQFTMKFMAFCTTTWTDWNEHFTQPHHHHQHEHYTTLAPILIVNVLYGCLCFDVPIHHTPEPYYSLLSLSGNL